MNELSTQQAQKNRSKGESFFRDKGAGESEKREGEIKMQSGYGVSEIQQFMVDTSVHSTLFSISSTTPATNPVAGGGDGQEIHHSPGSAAANSRKLINPFHHHHVNKPPPSPSPAAMDFHHFHSIPITQQLFTRLPHPHHHQFQLFHNNPAAQYDHHRRIQSTSPLLDHDPVPENHSASAGAMPSFLAANMNFKLAVDDSSGSGSKDGLNNDNNNNIAAGILHGDDASESRLRPWHRDDDCTIKEPFWRPLDLDCINRNNKRCKDKEPDSEPSFAKLTRDAGDQPTSGSNYKLFSELEAIYRPGSSTFASGGGGAYKTTNATNQTTGSGSALTGDDHPLIPATAADNNSTGGEDHQTTKKTHQQSRRRRQRKKAQMESIAAFFEALVKQLMDHQELLHQKFIDSMERREAERACREDARREQEAARAMREAAARAHDRALAAAREASMVSFLEKITGETISLPSLPHQLIPIPAAAAAAGGCDEKLSNTTAMMKTMMKTARWPKVEVQALIAVRSGFEGRFQEPGLKGPLWEEVSAAMSAVGYHRSAKRCKEKWENINKYFRKAKYSGRKRSQHSKTCPYFQQLDQLYSNPLPPPPPADKNSDFLDAIVVAGAGHQDFTDAEDIGESELSRTQAEDEEPPATNQNQNQNPAAPFNIGMQ